MEVIMDDLRLTDISSLEKFLQGNRRVAFGLTSIASRYQFIGDTLDKFNYYKLSKKDKRIVYQYLKKITGYKKAQLYRLINRDFLGNLVKKPYRRSHGNNHVYQPTDIKLLEKTDELHQRLNAHATVEIMRREAEIFNHKEFATIGQISPSHIDNLRKSPIYQLNWVNGTKARIVPIGVTMKPQNNNLPGSIRIDTVHQRDVYHY